MRLLLFLFYSLFSVCHAQKLVYQVAATYTVEEGLPDNTIYDLIVDKNGFLWIATERGVARFNGIKFENFETEGLPQKNCILLQEDSKGRIWMFFWGEVCIWDKGKILNRYNNQLCKSLFSTEVYTSFVEEGNKIFLGRRGDQLLEIENEQVKTSSITPYFALYRIGNSLYKTNPHSGLTALYQGEKLTFPVHAPPRAKAILHNKQQTLWLNAQGLSMLCEDSYTLFPSFAKGYKNLSFASEDRILLSGESGVSLVDMQAHILQTFLEETEVNQSIQDYQGNIWVGTAGNGLVLLSSQAKRFETLTALGNRAFSSLIIKGDSLYAASDESIFLYNLAQNQVSSTLLPKKSKAQGFRTGKKGLQVIMDLQTYTVNTTSILSIQESSENENYVKKVFNFPDISFETHLHSFEVFLDSGESVLCESVDQPLSLYPISKTEYYVGRRGGLAKYDLNTKQFTELNHLHSLLNNAILYIFYDSLSHTYFLSVEGYGVLQFDGKKILRHISKKEGLFHNTVQKIISTADGSLWFLHTYGISRLQGDRRRWKEVQYTVYAKGNLNASSNYDMEADKEHVWIATNKGIASMRFGDKVGVNPRFFPEILLQHDTTILRNSPSYSYLYDDNPLHILSDYPNLAQAPLEFFYRLEGKNWIAMPNADVTLTKLPPGAYSLEIKAVAPNYESYIQKLSLVVKPLWWQRDSIKVAGFLLLILLITGVLYKMYLNQLRIAKNEQKREQEIGRLRSVALLNQMNPHFLFNALHTLQSHVMTAQMDKAIQFIHTFARLLREMLKISQQTSITIQAEIDFLSLYLSMESQREQANFIWNIEVEENVFTSDSIPPFILQPFVENALKHGIAGLKERQGDIVIRFSPHSDEMILCSILDNGVGFVKASDSTHVSMGTNITQERLSLYKELPNPPFHFQAAIPFGTEVVVYLPLL